MVRQPTFGLSAESAVDRSEQGERLGRNAQFCAANGGRQDGWKVAGGGVRPGYDRLPASSLATTLSLAASMSSIFSGCLPPASAKSGRPPPLPPTIGAISLTIWPALTRLVRSDVTETT